MSCLLSDVLSSNHSLIYRLIEALRPNDMWKSLHSVIPESDLSATFSPSSPDDLVLALQNSFVTIQEVVVWLELIDAADALLLLKPDEPVEIVTHPQPRVVMEAGNLSVLRLTCEATSFPRPSYQWYFNGDRLIHQQCPVLEITPLTKDNSGTYYCLVSNVRGSRSLSDPCRVDVREHEANICLDDMSPLYATDKVALLISNCDYLKDVKLTLTVNDVETLAKSLAALGFRILAFKNLTKCDIVKVTKLFCKFLKPGTYSVFYYAGHGFKYRHIDYVQPIDCDSGCSAKCLPFFEIVNSIKATPSSFNLIMLDACRNPGGHSTDNQTTVEGHSQGAKQAKRGSIVVYATSPYTSAVEVKGHQNGLFMEHLKRHINKPVSVHDALRQTLRNLEEHKLSDYQIPVVKYDTPHDHSLTDDIIDSEVYVTNSQLWQSFSALPPDETFAVREDVVVHVCYSCERDVFCNSLIVRASVVPPFPDIHVDLEARKYDGASIHRVAGESSTLVISSLQNQATELQLSLVLRNVETGRNVCNRTFSCGYPLISAHQHSAAILRAF